MGGGFSFSLRMLDGKIFKVSGTVVGQSGDSDVDVEISGSDLLPDGVYSVPSQKGEAVKAVLNRDALKNARTQKPRPVSDDVFIDVSELKKKTQSDVPKKKSVFKRMADALPRGGKADPVDAQLVTPGDDGTLVVRRVKPGVTAKNPTTGKDVQLNTQDDATQFVADGGALADVPDEFLLTAIVMNLTKTGDTETRRFRAKSKGNGINGMTLIQDTTTGAMLGFKYLGGVSAWDDTALGLNDALSSSRTGEILPPYELYREALNELFSEKISELLGAEPMPMRIVQSRGGDLGGVALITELAHNRWESITSPTKAADDAGNYPVDIGPRSYARLRLLDHIIGNIDRHEGNFLLAEATAGDGQYEIVTIDNSLSFGPHDAGDELIDRAKAYNYSKILGKYDKSVAEDPEMWKEFVAALDEILQELAKLDLGDLSRFYEDAVDLIADLRPEIFSNFPGLRALDVENILRSAIERIVTALEMGPEKLAEHISRWKGYL